MTKSELIKTIEALKTKQTTAKKMLSSDNLMSRTTTRRFISNINSICDRLAANWNMSNDALHECQREQARNFFENTLAEAELFLAE